MKIIYVMVLLSSMLFAMQKQMILGSYSIEKNGLNAVLIAQKQVQNDEKLKSLMENGSLEIMSTKISDYTVVSVNIFSTYTDLLPAMKVFKTYYGDAFALNYPTKGFLQKESMKEVEKKAAQEALQNEALLAEEKSIEQEILDKQSLADEEEAKRLADLESQVIVVEEIEIAIEEPTSIEKIQNLDSFVIETPAKEENKIALENYYLIGALAFLVLLIGGLIIYKKTSKEDED